MPELPDVALFKQYLDSTALHQPIDAVQVQDRRVLEDLSPGRLTDTLEGRAFDRTRRHGKHLFAALDDDGAGWLAFHFGMTGRLAYYKRDDAAPDHARVRFDFTDGYHLAYVCPRLFGRLRLIDDPDAFIEAKDLGPDAYDLPLDAFRARLDGRRGTIKGALLNQQVVAGIGNIYGDEALFQIGVHPKTAVADLDDDAVEALHEALRFVFDAALEHDADPEQLPEDTFLLPHRYGDHRCPRCGGEIETVDVSGRTAQFCPSCQG